MGYNILFFTSNHTSKTRGGVERVTHSLTSCFQSQHNIYHISVNKPNLEDLLLKFQFVLPNPQIANQENLLFLLDFVQEKQIQIIINQSSDQIQLVSLLSRLNETQIKNNIKKTPIITTIHYDPYSSVKTIKDTFDLDIYNHNVILYPYFILRRIIRFYLRQKDAKQRYKTIYDNSNKTVLLSERYIPGFRKLLKCNDTDKKITAISNPFSYLPNQDADCTPKEKLAVYVGRLDFTHKRVDRLLKVWSRTRNHSDWKLVIVGDGEYLDFYRNMANKLKLSNIEFVGHQDPQKYYSRASVLCLTSTCEGLPMVILEALQYGVIPIAFDSFEAVHDMIAHNRNGILVEPFSITRFRNELDNLMSNPARLQQIRNNIEDDSGSLTEKFGIGSITSKWEELFDELIQDFDNK